MMQTSSLFRIVNASPRSRIATLYWVRSTRLTLPQRACCQQRLHFGCEVRAMTGDGRSSDSAIAVPAAWPQGNANIMSAEVAPLVVQTLSPASTSARQYHREWQSCPGVGRWTPTIGRPCAARSVARRPRWLDMHSVLGVHIPASVFVRVRYSGGPMLADAARYIWLSRTRLSTEWCSFKAWHTGWIFVYCNVVTAYAVHPNALPEYWLVDAFLKLQGTLKHIVKFADRAAPFGPSKQRVNWRTLRTRSDMAAVVKQCGHAVMPFDDALRRRNAAAYTA